MIRLIAAPPDAVLPGGIIDAQKGYPTADDTPEGLAHLTAHQSLSEVPLTIYRVRRDATWWVIVPDGTTLLTSLPGDIPGLVRAYSPVLLDGTAQAVRALEYASDGTLYVRLFGWGRPFHEREVTLDLTDPTGRAHAAWWTLQARIPPSGFVAPISVDEAEARRLAWMGLDMTRAQIDTLARLVLRLAGRAA